MPFPIPDEEPVTRAVRRDTPGGGHGTYGRKEEGWAWDDILSIGEDVDCLEELCCFLLLL